MTPEETRRAGALAALGALALLLFASSFFDKETVPMQCVYLASAQLGEAAELVGSSRVIFPFGISCTYSVGGQQQVLEQTSWMPVVPLLLGVALLGLAVFVVVKGERKPARVQS